LQEAGFEVVIAGKSEDEKIQTDFRSCSIFSLNQLSHLSKYSHSFEELMQHPQFDPQTRRISWLALQPNLIKLCQNLEFLKHYQNVNQQVLTSSTKPLYKLENQGVEQKLKNYTTLARTIMEKNSIEEINIASRTHPFESILQKNET